MPHCRRLAREEEGNVTEWYRSDTVERIIKTEGCYIGLFDAASPANKPALAAELMRSARARAAEQGKDWAALLYFNGSLADAGQRGELVSWFVLFDGVYKAVLSVVLPHPPLPPADQAAPHPGGQIHPLVCPSGRIVLASLHALNDSDPAPAVIVEPGTYRTVVHFDADQEAKHRFLDDLSEYPGADGPDWRILLQKL